ncbi:MAG: ATPase domain-containing protein [Ignisphaera sp.]
MYIFGITGLDKYLNNVLKPNSMVVVAGHPGSGKTTLASTICYSNALRGHKCLYVSFQEDREKLFNNMKSFDMDFYKLESQGLIKYVQFPLYFAVDDVVKEINNMVIDGGYRVIVVDSINALLEMVKDDASKRAWLQNYFYGLPKLVNGVCILVAELPYGLEKLKLGAIEFVSDAILILKHKVVNGILTRKLEIRKARFASINVAEVPFTIRENSGVEVYIPPLLEEVGPEGPELDVVCKSLKDVVNHIHKGMVMYIGYPPDARAIEYVPLLLGIVVLNNLKTLVVSYLYPPETVKSLIRKSFISMGIEGDFIEKLINRYLELRSLNPYAYSIEDIALKELSMVKEEHDAVVFHGTELISSVTPRERYLQALYNQLNYLKHLNKLVVRLGSIIDEDTYRLHSALADMVIRFDLVQEGDKIHHDVYVWRRGSSPSIFKYNKFIECCREITEKLKMYRI